MSTIVISFAHLLTQNGTAARLSSMKASLNRARGNGHKPSAKRLNKEEFKKFLDEQAQLYLRMSGDEFVRKWRAKEFDDPCSPNVMRVAFLLAE